MRALTRTLAVALAALFCMGQARPERLDYTLTPVFENGALAAVQYDVRFRGDADGETALRLPSSWGGQEELWRVVADLAAVSGAELRDGDAPNTRVLRHRPNARIHIRYRVVQDWQGAPNAQQGNTYRPAIQPTYFHLIGDASLVTPAERDLGTPVRFRVRRLPRGWSFASDLEHPGLTLGRVWSSVTVGGDFRILSSPADRVRVAIRGAWSFSDAEFSDRVAGIVAAQRRFWGDGPSPYLVTVLQLTSPHTGWLSLGGTGLQDAFAFFATPNAEAAQITRTLAHESMHTWIPGRIGGMPQENEAADYWLSEGFTDFYTSRILARDGAWTPAQFAEDLNRMLRAYAESPVREAPNARIVADFWREQPVQQLPYQRGRLLATLWDARLRANGRSLDDVMREMRVRAESGDALKAAQLFPAVAEAFGLDTRADIVSHVEHGAPILLPEDVFAPCGRVETRQAPRFHRGFDIEATTAHDNIITGVDPASPAYAAGMRDGMALVRRAAGEIGDADQEIAYVVREGEAERTIRYLPRAPGPPLTVQALVLDNDLEGETLARCVRVLGGG
jgi:predicted metalloprotease with PDZ domain